MRRDMKLILKILRYVRDKGIVGQSIDVPDLCQYSSAQVNYHVALCKQAGFLDVNTTHTMDGDIHDIQGLTWQGHDYLEQNCDG